MKRLQRSLSKEIASVRKQNAWIAAALLGSVLAVFAAAGLLGTDRSYTGTEDYADYVADRFAGREKWLELRTRMDIALQKKVFNGVYLGKDDYLIERHAASAYTGEQLAERLDALEELTARWDAQVMLVPTADNILTDKLPAYADVWDETDMLRGVWERIGMDHYIDVYNVLLAHQDEELYYRTDEHWTSLGAYYAYLAWTQAVGVTAKALNVDDPTVVSDTFRGSLSNQSGLLTEAADSIYYYPLTERREVNIIYDESVTSDTYYYADYLDTENAYGFYMDGDHAQAEIHAGLPNGKTLFVIKDSWANCLLPMIAAHYETVYVIDLQYLDASLFEYMASCEGAGDMDVLVIYSCDGFMESFIYD